MKPQSLSVVAATFFGSYPVENTNWTRYILDHRSTLIAEGKTVKLSLSESQTYRYRLLEFIQTHQLDASTLWIVVGLNGLGSPMGFVGVTELILPNKSTLDRLYVQFKTTQATLKGSASKLIG